VAETAPSGLVDDNVDAMFEWADLDSDGQVDYEEYKRIIHAGCAPDGFRIEAKTKEQAAAARVALAGKETASPASKKATTSRAFGA
jgi:calmodulin